MLQRSFHERQVPVREATVQDAGNMTSSVAVEECALLAAVCKLASCRPEASLTVDVQVWSVDCVDARKGRQRGPDLVRGAQMPQRLPDPADHK